MPALKFSFLMLFAFFPLMILLGDFIDHQYTKADAATATRQAATSVLKMGIEKGSLRDADIYPEQISAEYDQNVAERFFDESISQLEETSSGEPMRVINPAPGGIRETPPMVAIRSNVVRESLFKQFLSNLGDVEDAYVIQSESVAILEHKEVR